MITLLNFIYKRRQVDKKQITVLMTFPEDVMPIINELDNKGYKITVIAKFEEQYRLEHLNNITFIPGNKYIVKHIKALSSSKVILIDTYYLMLGGYTKKKAQTIIQTWHASGALKNFGD